MGYVTKHNYHTIMVKYYPEVKYNWDNEEQKFIWFDDNHPTIKELDNLIQDENSKIYQQQRKENYPSIQEQLDTIFHQGIEVWKEQIQAIKDKYPKP